MHRTSRPAPRERRPGRRLTGLFAPALFALAAFQPVEGADPAAPPRPPVYLSGWIAEFDAEDNPGRLEDEAHSYAFGLGFGTRLKRFLDLGGDIFGASAEFDNVTVSPPLLGTISGEMDLDLSAILLRARGVYPLRWFEPFLGGGIGWDRAKVTVAGSLLGIPGIAEEEKDTGILYEYAAGAGFVLSRKIDLVVAYRHLEMEADFDDLSDGEVDIGGDLYALELRFHPGDPTKP